MGATNTLRAVVCFPIGHARRTPTSKRQMVFRREYYGLQDPTTRKMTSFAFYGERKQATTKYYFSCLGSPTFDKDWKREKRKFTAVHGAGRELYQRCKRSLVAVLSLRSVASGQTKPLLAGYTMEDCWFLTSQSIRHFIPR